MFVTRLFFLSPTEPHFLHAIEYGNYVYFFFSEIAVEYTTLGKVRDFRPDARQTCGLWRLYLLFLSRMKSDNITCHINLRPTRLLTAVQHPLLALVEYVVVNTF